MCRQLQLEKRKRQVGFTHLPELRRALGRM
jgi:hypothetical protein